MVNGPETVASPEAFTTVTPNATIDLAWYPVPNATSYKVYRGTTSGHENRLIASGLVGTSYTDTGAAGSAQTPPTTGVLLTTTVGATDSATVLEGKLNTLLGAGSVHVIKGGGVYQIRFLHTGSYGSTAIALLRTDPTSLTSGGNGESDVLNVYDTGWTLTGDAALLTSTSLTGLDMPSANEIQQLVFDATEGQYTLTFKYPVKPSNLTVTSTGLSGTLTAGTHFYVVTALTTIGETLVSNEVTAVTAGNGSVTLSWAGIPASGAYTINGYRVYRGPGQGQENACVDTGSTGTTYTDTGTGACAGSGTPPVSSAVLASQTTVAIDWNASAQTVQTDLTTLTAIGTGNVVVTRNDDVYEIRFQGSLSDGPVQQLMATPLGSLKKSVEQLGGGILVNPGTATVNPRANIADRPTAINQVQILTIDATAGTYTLSLHVGPTVLTTAAIPYNAAAAQLRHVLQAAIAAAATSDPNRLAHPV